MGSIIKMLGTFFAGIGLTSIMPNNSSLAPTSEDQSLSSSWYSVIAVGGVVAGMLMYRLLRACGFKKWLK